MIIQFFEENSKYLLKTAATGVVYWSASHYFDIRNPFVIGLLAPTAKILADLAPGLFFKTICKMNDALINSVGQFTFLCILAIGAVFYVFKVFYR